jgi:hypothetical protein
LSNVISADSIATSVPDAKAIPTSAWKFFHLFRLILRQDSREYFVDAKYCGHDPGGGLVVAGHHYHLDLLPFQFGDRLPRRPLDRVGNADDPSYLAFRFEKHHCLPERLQFFRR